MGKKKAGHGWQLSLKEMNIAAHAQVAELNAELYAAPAASYAPLHCPCCGSRLKLGYPSLMIRCDCNAIYISQKEMLEFMQLPGAQLFEALRARVNVAMDKALHSMMHALVAAYGKNPPPPAFVTASFDPVEIIKVGDIPPTYTGYPTYVAFADSVMKHKQHKPPKKLTVPKDTLQNFETLTPALQEFFTDFIESTPQ